MFSIIYNANKRSVDQLANTKAPPKQSSYHYNLRSKGHVSKQDIKKQLLHRILPPSNLAQNSQNESGGAYSSKKTSSNNKKKTTTPVVVDKFTPPDSATHPVVMVNIDYSIVKDMKRSHLNISLFKLTRIMG